MGIEVESKVAGGRVVSCLRQESRSVMSVQRSALQNV